jgi:hypothetical protein
MDCDIAHTTIIENPRNGTAKYTGYLGSMTFPTHITIPTISRNGPKFRGKLGLVGFSRFSRKSVGRIHYTIGHCLIVNRQYEVPYLFENSIFHLNLRPDPKPWI